jgi:hypothetical protein
MSHPTASKIAIVGAEPYGLSVVAELADTAGRSAASAPPCRLGGRACRPRPRPHVQQRFVPEVEDT